jgi:alpha-beta hydrolase superfamily lysophospholipase
VRRKQSLETVEIQRFEPAGPARPRSLLIAHDLFRNVRSCAPLGEALSREGFSVLAVGLPGHGESTCHKGELGFYNFEDYVGPIARRLERIEPRPVVLTHGAASLFLCRILEQRKEKAFHVGDLPAAIFLSPLGPEGLKPMVRGLKRRHPLDGRLGWIQKQAYRWVRTPQLAAELFLSHPQGVDLAAYHQTVQDESWRVVASLARGREIPPLYQRLPARVLVGADSRVSPPASTRPFAEFLGVPLEELPQRGHDLLAAPGSEALARDLANWIEGQGLDR